MVRRQIGDSSTDSYGVTKSDPAIAQLIARTDGRTNGRTTHPMQTSHVLKRAGENEGNDFAQAWEDEALCTQTDPDIFFPDHAGDNGKAAKNICRKCPVQAQCLALALERDEQFGVWGALTTRERNQMRQVPS